MKNSPEDQHLCNMISSYTKPLRSTIEELGKEVLSLKKEVNALKERLSINTIEIK